MEYYSKFFGCEYMFSKLDSIFCPEFAFGAMENVGAVTYNENLYFFKGTPTEEWRLRRCYVILHELAHMWFGNLVTMRWWNDLWLNESFATYIGFATLSNHPELKKTYCLSSVDPIEIYDNGWVRFLFYREAAYELDASGVTHPVTGAVRDTAECETIFDSITYGKGASAIRQLAFIIGHTRLSEALSLYISNNKWSNTEFQDFINPIIQVSCRDGSISEKTIRDWETEYLHTYGHSILEPYWEADADQQVSSLRIQQTSVSYYDRKLDNKKLRNHKIQVAFFLQRGGTQVIEVLLGKEKTTVLDIRNYGLKNVNAVLLNHGDHAFVGLVFDEISLNYFQNHLSVSHSVSHFA